MKEHFRLLVYAVLLAVPFLTFIHWTTGNKMDKQTKVVGQFQPHVEITDQQYVCTTILPDNLVLKPRPRDPHVNCLLSGQSIIVQSQSPEAAAIHTAAMLMPNDDSESPITVQVSGVNGNANFVVRRKFETQLLTMGVNDGNDP